MKDKEKDLLVDNANDDRVFEAGRYALRELALKEKTAWQKILHPKLMEIVQEIEGSTDPEAARSFYLLCVIPMLEKEIQFFREAIENARANPNTNEAIKKLGPPDDFFN